MIDLTETPEDALVRLGSRPEGLTREEVARRLAEVGPNRVERVRRTSRITRFLRELVHFLAIVLWIAAALCFVADAVDPGQGMRVLGVAIVAVVLVNAAFSFWQELRTERVLAALEELLPHSVRVRRGGAVEVVEVDAVVPGDVVLLQAGDEVPADARVLEASALMVDTSAVTGESQPRSRDALPAGPDDDLLHARCMLLAGTEVVAGTALALVTATGGLTELGRIARLAQGGTPPQSPLVREIHRLSRVVSAFAVGLGVSFSVLGHALGLPLFESLVFGIGIIAANVPEGLLPTVTLSLAMAGQRMAKRKVVVRHLTAVESLGAATVIVTDKTGTLTEGRMVARRAWVAGDTFEIDGLSEVASAHDLRVCARLCHDTVIDATGQRLGDPLEIELVVRVGRGEEPVDAWTRIGAMPFDADRRRMSVAVTSPDGPWVLAKGAPESVLAVATSIRARDGIVPLEGGATAEVLAAAEAMARDGLRVLALAGRRAEGGEIDGNDLERELVVYGLVGLEDPPREGVAAAVATARSAGIRVVMATGDHPTTGLAIARRVGIARADATRARTGKELRELDDAALSEVLDAEEGVFARVSAEQKLRVVLALQKKGHVVAVTGDGVNDAPALKAADVGVAMGKSGSDVAREAADIVLVDDDFSAIVAAIEEGRAVWDNLRKFMTYILTSNVPEIVPYLAFVLFRVPLALTIVQVLAVDLGTDMLPALGLGADPPEPDVMTRPPRSPRERLLDRATLFRAYVWLGGIEAGLAMTVFFAVLSRGGYTHGVLSAGDPLYRTATTATFVAIVAAQVGNVLACRSSHASAFARSPFTSRLLVLGVTVEIVLSALVVYTPWGQALFGTAPLGLGTLALVAPVPFVLLALEELRKWVSRAARRRARA
ncbi:MAG: cation-transporting P-type ATPase [Myxococcales bacterium]|nr:cation-transporting P-type ATPase [Myxococcales bacterium]